MNENVGKTKKSYQILNPVFGLDFRPSSSDVYFKTDRLINARGLIFTYE